VEEASNNVFVSELAPDVKLALLSQIFGDPVWAETMTRDADPQFRNLAAREEYVNEIKRGILALPGANARGASEIIRRMELKSLA
jgi:hypothetical protein